MITSPTPKDTAAPASPRGLGPYDPDALLYPDSDGQPMADNTIQYEWIVTIKGNLDALFAGDPDVFVAGDLLWYAVKDDARARESPDAIRQAPDVMVAFGRPKGYRGSYKQWEENNIPPQVVFEILSPSNRHKDLMRKFDFYDRHGVEEYYIYDPKDGSLVVWMRDRIAASPRLRAADAEFDFVSPRLGVRFVPRRNAPMEIFYPDGRPFLTMQEMDDARARETARADAEEARANVETARADIAVQHAAAEAERANAEAERAEAAARRAERLAAQLRALGIEPE